MQTRLVAYVYMAVAIQHIKSMRKRDSLLLHVNVLDLIGLGRHGVTDYAFPD